METKIKELVIKIFSDIKESVEYAKAIEDLVEKIKGAVRKLDEQSELLRQHPYSIPIPLEEALEGRPTLHEILEERRLNSERALRQLKEKLDKLYEKLEEGEKYNKDHKTISGLIVKIIVGKAVADAEKTKKEAYEAIGRSYEAFDKFKEYCSQDDIRKMIQAEDEREWQAIRRRLVNDVEEKPIKEDIFKAFLKALEKKEKEKEI